MVGPGETSRVTESVEAALRVGQGMLIAATPKGRDRVFSEKMACADCSLSFPELTPQSFSFNSPQGMCVDCNGIGMRVEIDPELVVPDAALSLDEGAVKPWGPDVSKKSGWAHGFRGQICAQLGIDMQRPWRRIPKQQRDWLLHGTGERRFKVKWAGKSGRGTFEMTWEGVLPRLMRRFKETGVRGRQALVRAVPRRCALSHLRRRAPARRERRGPGGRTHARRGLGVHRRGSARDSSAISSSRAPRARSRPRCSRRSAAASTSSRRSASATSPSTARVPSLSGGEAQRIRLASQVGSELTGVIYILDEPSIGLHQRDNRRLLSTLERMRDIGNTVVVVEHDEETIRNADHVIDFGPGAGVEGGRIVHAGTPESLERCEASLTGAYLAGRRAIPVPETRRHAVGSLKIVGARENNLADVDVEFPLGVLVAVTGVSGAGKSTLVNDVLYPALARRYHAATGRVGRHRAIHGAQQLDKVIDVDQRPIGRTPRSNPATYIKVFDEIRAFFAQLPEARVHGYTPGRFSFNVKGGRCEACQGDGVRQIEMHFLADVYVRCEECQGKRFNEATLRVGYKGKSIADVLELTVREAAVLFAAHPSIAGPLRAARGSRPRLPAPRPALAHALGRRSPAHQARARVRAPRHRPHALHPRRADDGPALRRRAQADRRARAPGRRGQHA